VEITLNGERREVPGGTTVASLLESLSLSPASVAVEVDLEIVPRATYATRGIAEGATVEIVTFVGGG
jgi:thiamine biosynthesis protein ThiS